MSTKYIDIATEALAKFEGIAPDVIAEKLAAEYPYKSTSTAFAANESRAENCPVSRYLKDQGIPYVRTGCRDAVVGSDFENVHNVLTLPDSVSMFVSFFDACQYDKLFFENSDA